MAHIGEARQTLNFHYMSNPNLIGELTLRMRNAMLDLAMLTEAKAKRNVKPGVGPGPHPHRTDHGWTWVDTGNLMRDIKYEMYQAGRKSVGFFVGAWTVPYGRYLEEGFHGPSGRFYRYPWLAPALEDAKKEMDAIIKKAFAKRVIVQKPTTGTGWGYRM